jgi:co-chaperonin GroES (HSP10)
MLKGIKLKNDNVLIQDIDDERVINGIILPKEKWNRKAKVILSSSSQLKPGDIILKTIGNGTEFRINGQKYEILHIDKIFTKIEDER